MANLEPDNKMVTFVYKNWKGKISVRVVIPERLYFGATDYHKEEQYLLEAFDLEKKEKRTFAMADIASWTPVEITVDS